MYGKNPAYNEPEHPRREDERLTELFELNRCRELGLHKSSPYTRYKPYDIPCKNCGKM